jgi:hypothetical protein
MTSADLNDLVPAQKLEWVTPKISLMEAGDTEGDGKAGQAIETGNAGRPGNTTQTGPS